MFHKDILKRISYSIYFSHLVKLCSCIPYSRGPQPPVRGPVLICGLLGTRPRKRQASMRSSICASGVHAQNHSLFPPSLAAATAGPQSRKGWEPLLYITASSMPIGSTQ